LASQGITIKKPENAKDAKKSEPSNKE
jgi:hypothetical protein